MIGMKTIRELWALDETLEKIVQQIQMLEEKRNSFASILFFREKYFHSQVKLKNSMSVIVKPLAPLLSTHTKTQVHTTKLGVHVQFILE